MKNNSMNKICLIVFSVLLAVLTSVWIALFFLKYSWKNWAASAICYVVSLTIIPIAIFVSRKLVFRVIALFLILFAAVFTGFELHDYFKRTQNLERRLLDVTVEELHNIEKNYKCCGIYGSGEYAISPKSCCGQINGVHLCPYIHGCNKPYYYWESLKETWRLIGDFLKFAFILVCTFFCFSHSLRDKKEDDEETDEVMQNSTIDEEDLWLMEERRGSVKNNKEFADSKNKGFERKNVKLSFVDSISVSDASGMNEKFESCCELKDEQKMCSLTNPESCKVDASTSVEPLSMNTTEVLSENNTEEKQDIALEEDNKGNEENKIKIDSENQSKDMFPKN